MLRNHFRNKLDFVNGHFLYYCVPHSPFQTKKNDLREKNFSVVNLKNRLSMLWPLHLPI